MAEILNENMSNSDTDTELARELGLGAAMSIGIGTMVCAGIFVLPGIAAAKAGPIVVLAFALCGLVAVLIALYACPSCPPACLWPGAATCSL